MAALFIIFNCILLLLSSSFVHAHSQARSRDRYAKSRMSHPSSMQQISSEDSVGPEFDDDPLIALPSRPSTTSLAMSKNEANAQQIEHFTRLIIERLNIKETPNVSIQINHGNGIPSLLVKQLEQKLREQEYLNKEKQEQNRDESVVITDRAIVPSEKISKYSCQRQISNRFSLNSNSLKHIECFYFSKASIDSTTLPTNQVVKQLRIYINKDFFNLNNQQHNALIKPDMIQIYQVFRPTSDDNYQKLFSNLTDTIRISINQIRELKDNWLELTIDPQQDEITIQQMYQQFILPWYGIAINRQLDSSSSSHYRSYTARKRLENSERSTYKENENKGSDNFLPYMLVEYGNKISSSSGHRTKRSLVRSRPAKACDPTSPCCRHELKIDLNKAGSALDFVIHPRVIDIGECIGVCNNNRMSPSEFVKIKQDQEQNKPNSGHSFVKIHIPHLFNKSLTTSRGNKGDEPSSYCCSYSRTGGLEITYTTTYGGPVIRKYIPNMIVESCKCALPATI